MIETYFNRIHQQLEQVQKSQTESMTQAAAHMAKSLQQGGIIQLFGCGHSHLLTLDVYYRAGGMVPVQPILHEPLMLHEGALRSSELERKNNYAETFMKEQTIKPEDTVIVISTSGRNPVPVDVALEAKKAEATVVVITSIAYSSSQPSRHEQGYRLADVADVVIDNAAPPGDALLELEEVEVPFGPSSTAVGATILQAVMAQTVQELTSLGIDPPVFLSGNIDGADERNKRLIESYKDRIKL